MGIFFSGKELIGIAIEIERNGFQFYTALAQSAPPASRETFTYLAEQEEKHRAVFEEMGKRAGPSPLDSPVEDHDAYVRALVDSIIFTSRLAINGEPSIAEALQLGIRVEKDSILFYQEMRELARRTDRHAISAIIAEERTHLARLTALSKEAVGN